jgi:hypothetical protein
LVCAQALGTNYKSLALQLCFGTTSEETRP